MDSEKHQDLGAWLGRQQVFATLAGTCSAARAQCLKQVRDSKLLDELGLTWEEFCKEHAGLSRAHADNLIRQHERFGDTYFRLAEIARVSPQRYQQIAAHVDADSIEVDGQKIPLKPENAAKVRAAIQKLRDQILRPPAPSRPPAGVVELQVRAEALAGDVAKAIRALSPGQERASLTALIAYAANKFRTLAREVASLPGPQAGT